jgi:hypothetical protein
VFALVGYQTTNENLQMALLNAAKHRNEEGRLIIDPWFGPAVIAQKPKHIFFCKTGTGYHHEACTPQIRYFCAYR